MRQRTVSCLTRFWSECSIPRPAGHTVFTAEEAKEAANELGYPVLVRPSYVLGGQGMQIAINDEDIDRVHRHYQPDCAGASDSGR